MGFLDTVKSLMSGGGQGRQTEHWVYVRCRRCGEVIKTRIDLQSGLSRRDEGGYLTRKTLVGNQLCFERIEVTLLFDENYQLVDQEINRGHFITAEAYEAAHGNL